MTTLSPSNYEKSLRTVPIYLWIIFALVCIGLFAALIYMVVKPCYCQTRLQSVSCPPPMVSGPNPTLPISRKQNVIFLTNPLLKDIIEEDYDETQMGLEIDSLDMSSNESVDL